MLRVRTPLRRSVPDKHRWISPGTPVSSTNKADRHGIAEMLLKVALNTINQTKWVIRTYIFQCERRISGITIMNFASSQKIKKPTNCNVFGSKKAEMYKQDRQNRIG